MSKQKKILVIGNDPTTILRQLEQRVRQLPDLRALAIHSAIEWCGTDEWYHILTETEQEDLIAMYERGYKECFNGQSA